MLKMYSDNYVRVSVNKCQCKSSDHVLFVLGIAVNKASTRKNGANRKLNTRGMLNVKNVDVYNDDDFSGPKAFQLRPSDGGSLKP